MERHCDVCGRPLELMEVDRGENIAWYACPLHSEGRAEDAEGHTAYSAPLTDTIEKELTERQR